MTEQPHGENFPKKEKPEGQFTRLNISELIRDQLAKLKKKPEVVEVNPFANSHITEEEEDRKLIEQLVNVEDEEKNIAELQATIKDSTLPSIEQFPKEYKEWLQQGNEDFNQFLEQLQENIAKGGYIDVYEFKDKVSGKLAPFIATSTDANIFGQVVDSKEEALSIISRARKLYQLFLGKPADNPGFVAARNTLRQITEHYQRILAQEELNKTLHEELQQGDHFLSHGVSADNSLSVCRSGYIGSRQSQLDRVGKAVINTAGNYQLIEYPDHVEYYDRGKWQHYTEGTIGAIDSRLKRERSEVLADIDKLYGNIGFAYFVFPAADILQDVSYYKYDGIHLFAKDYDSHNNPRGYEISLAERPHMMVARSSNREQIAELIDQAEWIQDKEQYMRDNIMFIDEDNFAQNNDISRQIRERAKQQFSHLTFPLLGEHIVPSCTLDPHETRFAGGAQKVNLFKRA